VQPNNCKYSFLVDTGSIISILPVNSFSSCLTNHSHKFLYAANGSTIKTFGEHNLKFDIGDKTYNWSFTIADVSNAILGADFLAHHDFLVDCRNKKLINKQDNTTINLNTNNSRRIGTINHEIKYRKKTKITTYYNTRQKSESKIHTLETLSKTHTMQSQIPNNTNKINNINKIQPENNDINEVKNLKIDKNMNTSTTDDINNNRNNNKTIKTDNNITNLNQKIIEEILSTTKSDQQKIIKNSTTHQIITNGIPVHTKVRLLTDEKLTEAKKIFQEMLDNGVIRQSSSNWSSPLLMKRKKDNTWRCCGDYRRLNAITIKDEYPVPLIKDVTTRLKDARYFSKLDLEKAYHQIPMAVEDIPKTAIITPFGLFEFIKMPFGLKNAASTFQRYMDNIFRGIDFIVVYLDDILIGSKNFAVHKTHITTIFTTITTNSQIEWFKSQY